MVISGVGNFNAKASDDIKRDGLGIVAGVVAVAIVILSIAIAGGIPSTAALLALAGFAAVGVASLACALFGLVRLRIDREREEIARMVLNGPDRSVAVTDERGDVTFANEGYAGLVGAEGIALDPVRAWSGDPDASTVLGRLHRSAKAGRAAREDVRLSVGEPRWLQVTAYPLNTHELGRVVWEMVDVTSIRATEEHTFRSARDAVSYLDQCAVGFVAAREDGVVEHLNATMAEWLAVDLTEFERRELRIGDFLNDAQVEHETGVRETAARVEIESATGTPRSAWLLERRTAVPARRRLMTFVEGTAIETSTEMDETVGLDRFYDRLPVSLATLNADGTILRANTTFAHMLSDGTIRNGTPFVDLVPASSRDAIDKALAAAASGRTSIEPIDIVLNEDRDQERYVRLQPAVVRVVENEHVVIIHAQESTEQKAIEAAYIQGQKMQAVGLLAGGLAHDFNNVLSAITMSADLLLETHGVGDPSHKDIRNVKTSASKAASLVRQLLAYSRKQTLRPTVLHLADTLSDGRMLYQRLANPAELELELGSDLWPVKADLGQFEQVITNLVANARDAMPNGGRIVISARNLPAAEAATLNYQGFNAADYVMVEVTDTGTGMPPEVQKQIFDPFYTTKEVGKGTGLGMAMVYGIVKQSDGFIYVDSEVGRGTRFRIMLPRHQAAAGSSDGAATTQPKAPQDLTGSGTVLVVEDDNAVRPGAVRALTSRGYTVHEAMDGEEALEVLEELEGKVDIIISDVVMPGMDGPTFLREMRAIYGDDVPFVFASGHAEDAFAKNLPEGSVFSFLPKPYSLSDLATKVKDVLAGKM